MTQDKIVELNLNSYLKGIKDLGDVLKQAIDNYIKFSEEHVKISFDKYKESKNG